MLGKITVGGKYAAHDPAATNGTETAVAVLWGKADAIGGDAPAVAVVRGPAIVNRHDLVFAGTPTAPRNRRRPCRAAGRSASSSADPGHILNTIPEPEAFPWPPWTSSKAMPSSIIELTRALENIPYKPATALGLGPLQPPRRARRAP